MVENSAPWPVASGQLLCREGAGSDRKAPERSRFLIGATQNKAYGSMSLLEPEAGMVQILGFSGNSTDRPRASTVEVLSVAGPTDSRLRNAGSGSSPACLTRAGGVGLSAAEREFFPLAQGDGFSPAAGD